MSLRGRVGAAAGIAVAVTVIAAAIAVYVAVRSNLRGEIDQALAARLAPLAGDPGAGPRRGPQGSGRPGGPPGGPLGGRPGGPPRRGPDRFGRPPRGERFGGAGGYVQFVAVDGVVQGPPGATVALPVSERAREIARTGAGALYEDVDVQNTHVRVLTRGLGPDGAVQAARPLAEVDSVLGRVLTALAAIGIAGIVLAAALGVVVARLALVPVARFTRRTEAIAARMGLSERMDVVGHDELARLAQSFNATLDALERSVESQRQLVADASHELRTPMASLRANVQVLEHADRLPREELDALRADIVSEIDELTALVADIVELARGAKPDEALDDIRLDEVVRALAERAERRGLGGVRFSTQLEPTLIRAEPERVARAVSNLLDNARKFSPPEGLVEVSLADGVLSVRDHGPGFSEEDLPHVFDRFYRAASARATTGSGLGLAIVRQAAEATGGWARAANAPGGGALLQVKF